MGTPAIRLGRSEVHVWLTRPDAVTDAALLRSYDALISPDERHKQQRYYFQRDRHVCLVTRALLRTTLSRYADRAPEDWVFERNEYGRPRVVPSQRGPELRFNLSHTAGLIACAVTVEREVGVDVENTSRSGQTVAIADRFFSAEEVRALRALPRERQRGRFFDYWTLKESYIKARGMGLALPLSQFGFRIDGRPGIGITFDARLGDDPQSWQFELYRPSDRHVLALGVRKGAGGDLTVRVESTLPGSARDR